ncbi:zinc metalloprotease HtpX [Thermodesulfobacteriota bacterium]
MSNTIKTTLLLGGLTGLIIMIGGYLGGPYGMILALFFAALMNFGSYWLSDKIVLKMYRARVLSPGEISELFELVEELSARADLPMPKICLIESDAPNAFATGRNPENAVVAVTTGLLKILDREEIKGVLAHELAHIKNRDILISSIAAMLAGTIMSIATMLRWAAIFGGVGRDDDDGGLIGLLAMTILAPFVAVIIQLAISRTREYKADDAGAGFAGSPEGLATALEKLGHASKRVPMRSNPATAHMFIVNPLAGRAMMSLFSTHPPLEKRVERLRAYGR